MERDRGAVVARREGDLVPEVEAEPVAGLQVEVGGDAAAPDPAVLVGAQLQPAAPAGQVDGLDAAAGRGGRSRTVTASQARAR